MWMLHHLQGIITIKASYFQGLTQAIVSPFAIQFTRQILIYRSIYYSIKIAFFQYIHLLYNEKNFRSVDIPIVPLMMFSFHSYCIKEEKN